MLRSWLGDWIGTFLGECHIPSIVVSSNSIGVGARAKTDVTRPQGRRVVVQDLARHDSGRDGQCGLHRVRDAPSHLSHAPLRLSLDALPEPALLTYRSKIWDCNSGEALHSFAHNHIVRSVALDPQQQPQYLLTVSL
jgi:hypothetical protein